MRLLQRQDDGSLILTENNSDGIPPYVILSHTWGEDGQEVTFNDINTGVGQEKQGYQKIDFCGKQAAADGFEYFWVDTCCIDKSNSTELQEAVISMFRWYQNAAKCYVYLSDVVSENEDQCQQTGLRRSTWKVSFRNSRWFTRGWTLQELLAPRCVEFFSKDGYKLGSKISLCQMLHEITGIDIDAFESKPLSSFSARERMSWLGSRDTRRKEDRAYCLLGIFNVSMRIQYGEGEEHAMARLRKKIDLSNGEHFARCKAWLLNSLNDGSPFTRVNHLSKPSDGTFTWIFNTPSSDSLRPETKFLAWLQNGHDIFWIKGQPGSGKSTIMKFLTGFDNQNDQTLQYLKTWAAPRNPYILTFYFWLADTANIQNSFRGFLCHLLHQLLSKTSPEVVSGLLPSDRLQGKRNINNWDLEELERLLKTVAFQAATDTPLCFFVDALDECLKSDLDSVVRVIRELIKDSRSNIKFCVSSRPEQRIEFRLRDSVSQSLELHTLTEDDIRKYVTNELENCWEGNNSAPTKKQKDKLVDQLVSLSQGVFLWAFLVAKRLRESIDMGDTVKQLQEQLKGLPRDMLKLYENMLEKSGATEGPRRAEAASYFQFILTTERCHYLWWGRHRRITMFVPLYERYHGKFLVRNESIILKTVQRRISNLCAGLVVIDNDTRFGTVRFFHRTARDYFQDPSAKAFLEESDLSELDIQYLFVDAWFRNRHSLFAFNLRSQEVQSLILICQDMQTTSVTDKAKFLQHIDQTFSHNHALKYPGIKENWVYEQAKNLEGYDKVLDFTSYAFSLGSMELLSHHLKMERRCLSGRYKDYLLLCCARQYRIHQVWTRKLLGQGANPNATFYWGLQSRLKTSPWLKCLVDIPYDHELDMDAVDIFLDGGANIDDRTVLLKSLDRSDNWMNPVELRRLSPGSQHLTRNNKYLVIEVNAKFLLEELCRIKDQKHGSSSDKVLSRPEVQKAKAYRRILLIYPGYGYDEIPLGTVPMGMNEEFPDHSACQREDIQTGHFTAGSLPKVFTKKFAKITVNESERLLDSLEILPHGNHQQINGRQWERRICEMKEIWETSPKVPGLRQYLEEKGYYKASDDPDVLQEPIPMFEDDN